MNQNQTPVYVGLDIAKATLQLQAQDRSTEWLNTTKGRRQLVKYLSAIPSIHVICEATGGYERAVVQALHSADIPVSVINPARARQFARASGELAKTDPIDANQLAAFGRAFSPNPTPPRSPSDAKLEALVTRRLQLLELQVAERQRAEGCTDANLGKLFATWLVRLAKEIQKVEELIAQLVAEQDVLSKRVELLDQIAGVGRITAVSVLAALPELGQLNRRQVAALAGLCPYNRESGKWVGKRCISGGRADVRRALYMAALCASHRNHVLKKFYDRLIEAGKPAKLALTAVMRKLIVLMNRILKDQTFRLQNPGEIQLAN